MRRFIALLLLLLPLALLKGQQLITRDSSHLFPGGRHFVNFHVGSGFELVRGVRFTFCPNYEFAVSPRFHVNLGPEFMINTASQDTLFPALLWSGARGGCRFFPLLPSKENQPVFFLDFSLAYGKVPLPHEKTYQYYTWEFSNNFRIPISAILKLDLGIAFAGYRNWKPVAAFGNYFAIRAGLVLAPGRGAK
ncbi:MAG: hypothetical protein H6581_16685 [Bacteroidia bacterium]|nr:hypothetical protein [Bacteroidia bacterium]